MAKQRRRRGQSGSPVPSTHTRSRYNLERDPLRSERRPSHFEIPADHTGWNAPRRRRMAAWLGVSLVLLILIFGALAAIYGGKVWNLMIGRWQ